MRRQLKEYAVPCPVACVPLLVVLAAGLASSCGSTSTPISPTALSADTAALSASQSAERCVNVAAEGATTLGFPVLPNGTTGFGGNWAPVNLGGINGQMASVVIDQTRSGQGQQGALHLTLEHVFQALDGDYFVTRDRAVCAPGNNPTTCHVNDVLTIIGGTGIFSNANGSLRNHGTIDFAQGSLEFSVRGRICGDGL